MSVPPKLLVTILDYNSTGVNMAYVTIKIGKNEMYFFEVTEDITIKISPEDHPVLKEESNDLKNGENRFKAIRSIIKELCEDSEDGFAYIGDVLEIACRKGYSYSEDTVSYVLKEMKAHSDIICKDEAHIKLV